MAQNFPSTNDSYTDWANDSKLLPRARNKLHFLKVGNYAQVIIKVLLVDAIGQLNLCLL